MKTNPNPDGVRLVRVDYFRDEDGKPTSIKLYVDNAEGTAPSNYSEAVESWGDAQHAVARFAREHDAE